ncbi:ComF family protein [Prochlorococcus sp. MIT 1313]|uniref:ComF family protein n=1 Tax=Prochlorococcus sp. MIT 1313 TaxID=3082538 RepID=UPI0039AFD34F
MPHLPGSDYLRCRVFQALPELLHETRSTSRWLKRLQSPELAGTGLVRRSSPPAVVESASQSEALSDPRLSKTADPARPHQRCAGPNSELEKPKPSKSCTPTSGQWLMPSLPWPLTPPPCNRGTTPSRQTATRQRNQIHSFEAVPGLSNNATDWSFHRVWIVDDILTTGATALAAKNCLQNLGITVGGAICLAKTPKQKSKYKPKTIRNG